MICDKFQLQARLTKLMQTKNMSSLEMMLQSSALFQVLSRILCQLSTGRIPRVVCSMRTINMVIWPQWWSISSLVVVYLMLGRRHNQNRLVFPPSPPLLPPSSSSFFAPCSNCLLFQLRVKSTELQFMKNLSYQAMMFSLNVTFKVMLLTSCSFQAGQTRKDYRSRLIKIMVICF